MVAALALALATLPSTPSKTASADYTPISELVIERSADGKSLTGKLVLGQNWNAAQGWGRHGQPWPFFAPSDRETFFLNNAWGNAGLSASFGATDGSNVVAFTVTRGEGAFPETGWLMFVLEGHEYGRGEHSQQQFFAAEYPELTGVQGPPGGSVIPITLHRPLATSLRVAEDHELGRDRQRRRRLHVPAQALADPGTVVDPVRALGVES